MRYHNCYKWLRVNYGFTKEPGILPLWCTEGSEKLTVPSYERIEKFGEQIGCIFVNAKLVYSSSQVSMLRL